MPADVTVQSGDKTLIESLKFERRELRQLMRKLEHQAQK
jgi:hypothetical protein